MNIYWSLKSIPELADLSKDERKRVWAAMTGKSFKSIPEPLGHWQYWVALLGAGLVLYLLLTVVTQLASVDLIPSRVARAAVRFVVFLPFFVFIRHVGFSLTRPHIRKYLQGKQTEEQVDA